MGSPSAGVAPHVRTAWGLGTNGRTGSVLYGFMSRLEHEPAGAPLAEGSR